MQPTNQTSDLALTTESTIPVPPLGFLAPLPEPSVGVADLGVDAAASLALQPSLRPSNFELQTCDGPSAVLQTSSFKLRTSRRRSRRHGAIARLPKDCRDMVNRMLSNGVFYKHIVAALKECGHTVSERNISNWYASGYKDWQDDQAEALHHARIQEALLDHFRQSDSSQLAEIGLQTAATRLSEILLQKTIDGEDIESALPQYRQMVDLLCRVNREILSCHKHREDSAIPPQGPSRERDAAQLKYIETNYSQGSVAPDPDTELPPAPARALLPDAPLPRSAGILPAVSPAFGRPAADEPETADPLADQSHSVAPQPVTAPDISNNKSEPGPNASSNSVSESAPALNSQPSTLNGFSESAGTVQKLSPPGEAAAAPDTALRPLA